MDDLSALKERVNELENEKGHNTELIGGLRQTLQEQREVMGALTAESEKNAKKIDDMVAQINEQNRLWAIYAQGGVADAAASTENQPPATGNDGQQSPGENASDDGHNYGGVAGEKASTNRKAPTEMQTKATNAAAAAKKKDAAEKKQRELDEKKQRELDGAPAKPKASAASTAKHKPPRKTKVTAAPAAPSVHKGTAVGKQGTISAAIEVHGDEQDQEPRQVTNRALLKEAPIETVRQLRLYPMTENGYMIVGNAGVAQIIQFHAEDGVSMAKVCRRMHHVHKGENAPVKQLCKAAAKFATDTMLKLLKPILHLKPLFVLDGTSRRRDKHADAPTFLATQPEPTKSVSLFTLQNVVVGNDAHADVLWAVAEAAVGACADALDDLTHGFEQVHPTH